MTVATAARIAFVLQAVRTVQATDPSVKTDYGELARDTGEEPVESYFDSVANAQVMCTERLDLLKANRRRFRQEVRGASIFTDGTLPYSQTVPTVTVIDDDRLANHKAMVVEGGIDFATNRSTIVTWGSSNVELWLLSTGVWADPGHWDDNDVWKDAS